MLTFIPKTLLPLYGIAFCFSFFINLLSIFSMWHFLLVIDRVIPGRNVATLVVITLAVLIALGVMSMLEAVRSRLLVRLAIRLDQKLGETVIASMFAQTGDAPYESAAADFQTIKKFLGGTGIFAFFDLPWMPLFLAVNFLLHPLLGMISTVGAVVLLILLVFNEWLTRRAAKARSDAESQSAAVMRSAQRNIQVVYSMGMLPEIVRRWKDANTQDLVLETRVNQRVGIAAAINKSAGAMLRLVITSVGAMLVIFNEITIGMMIVARMVMGRALSPLGALLGGWKQFQEARLAAQRLKQALQSAPKAPAPSPQFKLGDDRPSDGLQVDHLTLQLNDTIIQENISFRVQAGEILVIKGPSGSGKTTLLRTIAGLLVTRQGRITLNEQDLTTLTDPALRMPLIGYLPQEVELQALTVAENIGRLETHNSEAVIAAAQLAGAHEMILRLPKGYDTLVASRSANLSGGQRQRIALAQAFYKFPRLILLDEPDANLDTGGWQILERALAELKSRGCIILVVSHRTWVREIQDHELNLERGVRSEE